MKRLISALIILAAALPSVAEDLTVTGLRVTDDVLHGKLLRTDLNGAEAAVIKVQLPVPGVTFDGNLIGEPEFYGSEYWVWLEGDAAGSGTSMFDVRCPGTRTLRVYFPDYGVERLKSKTVYELTFDIPRELLYGYQRGPADTGGDYLVLSVKPAEGVMVKIDGTPRAMRGGQLNEFLTYGDHTYSIEAPGYIGESGAVTLKRGGGKVERDITLRSAKGTLTVKAETPGAVITINGERRGAGSWSGALIAGNYQIEVSLEGHRPYSTAVVMREGEDKNVSIPALRPIYGVLQVDYYPSKSQVTIDGKPAGATPLALGDLTVGTHTIEISADGYQPHSQQISLVEGEPLHLTGELKAKPRHTAAEGMSYYNNKQYDKAIPIFRELAELGDAPVQSMLGYCYAKGEGVTQSDTEAEKWYRKAAEQGNKEGEYGLAMLYWDGIGVPQSYEEAVKWLRKSAEQGYAVALYALGICYANGFGATKSFDEATKWWRKAAEQGNVEAQNTLGNYYYKGVGVPQSYEEAVKWWRKAAEQGNAQAQYNIGVAYRDGVGIKQSAEEAAKWFRKSADQGYALAQCGIGWLYDLGIGVPQSYEEAVKWCRKAANQGNAIGQFNLGTYYWEGRGVTRDTNEAVRLMRLAAKQDYAEAKQRLREWGYNE